MSYTLIAICFVLSCIIVNIIAGLLMKITGAKIMIFDGYKRLMIIAIVTWFLANAMSS